MDIVLAMLSLHYYICNDYDTDLLKAVVFDVPIHIYNIAVMIAMETYIFTLVFQTLYYTVTLR
jgi:hypothetical protein